MTRQRIAPILLAIGGIAPAAVPAASFDCDRTTTLVEQAICADPDLDRLDEDLAATYRQALDSAPSDDSARQVRSAQRKWLAARNRCVDQACIRRAYEQRLGDLGSPEASPPWGSAGDTSLAGKEHITETSPNFEIKVIYPRLAGSDAATAAANGEVERAVESLVADFREQYRDLMDGDQGEHMGPPWSLTIQTQIVYSAKGYWLVALDGYEYTGGAHGIPLHLVFVLDRTDGHPIPPAGLFRPHSDWLKVLSEYCYDALAAREPFTPGDDWLKKGTAPQEENYQLLLPGPDGLTVIFSAYQVGPYAIGEHEVTVPYAKLAPVLNPALFASKG